MLVGDVPGSLTWATCRNKSPSIFKQGRPIKYTLKDFWGHSLSTMMPSIRRTMTMRNDVVNFMLWNTSPRNSIHPSLVEKRLFPNVVSHIREELLLMLVTHVRWQDPTHQVFHKVCEPRIGNSTHDKELVIQERIIYGYPFTLISLKFTL